MAERGTTEATTARADHAGAQLESVHDEGRRLMVNALHTHVGISKPEAQRLVDGFEHAGTIRRMVRHADTEPRASAFGGIELKTLVRPRHGGSAIANGHPLDVNAVVSK